MQVAWAYGHGRGAICTSTQCAWVLLERHKWDRALACRALESVLLLGPRSLGVFCAPWAQS